MGSGDMCRQPTSADWLRDALGQVRPFTIRIPNGRFYSVQLPGLAFRLFKIPRISKRDVGASYRVAGGKVAISACNIAIFPWVRLDSGPVS
jgi:hypothetical protein